jgi:hypothetical protein
MLRKLCSRAPRTRTKPVREGWDDDDVDMSSGFLFLVGMRFKAIV